MADDPLSYRPISILPAMSKILETMVKNDLDRHLASVDGYANTQFGFRAKRSTAGAVATAHAAWSKAKQDGKLVGILAFDYSAGFDTVTKTSLLPVLEELGIVGMELAWFADYLTDRRQQVDWQGSLSEFLDVLYGVPQGSILGPLLYVILMRHLSATLSAAGGKGGDVTFADDSTVWCVENNCDNGLRFLKDSLEAKADAFANFSFANGLKMNGSKSQLAIVGKRATGFSINVDGAEVVESNVIEFLGIKVTNDLSMATYAKDLATKTKQAAGMVRRLAVHFPKGSPYLRMLAQGLIGKINFSAAAVSVARTGVDVDKCATVHEKATQVNINNIARTLSGKSLKDHVRIADLLQLANLPSYNSVVTKSTAMETWCAMTSSDGPGGSKNPLGLAMVRPSRLTRSNLNGEVPNQFKLDTSTLANRGIAMWNSTPDLRAAATKSQAHKVACKLAKDAPI